MQGMNITLLVGPVLMAVGGGAISFAPSTLNTIIEEKLVAGGGVATLVCGGIVWLMSLYLKWPIKRFR